MSKIFSNNIRYLQIEPMRKFLITALFAATILGTATPSYATAPDEYQEHNDLVTALLANGVLVYLDSDECVLGLGGFYHSPSRSLVICNGGSRQMTPENMNTLVHEAVHASQDCRNGVQGDRILHPVLKPGVIEELAAQTSTDLNRIAEVYRSHGADDQTISLEFEAFTVAAGMPASAVTAALNTICGAAR
jgi:hypothetical protein